MKKVKQLMAEFLKDESGQGATEYILLLVVVIALATIFKDRISAVVSEKVADISGKIGSFQGSN